MIVRIDLKYPLSNYLQMNEETIGDIPVDNELCEELTKLEKEPTK